MFSKRIKDNKISNQIYIYIYIYIYIIAFECPYQSCSKRFSRSDNLNQHIRIHRHSTSSGGSKDQTSKQQSQPQVQSQQRNNTTNISSSSPRQSCPSTTNQPFFVQNYI